jgi:hypothetical protein
MYRALEVFVSKEVSRPRVGPLDTFFMCRQADARVGRHVLVEAEGSAQTYVPVYSGLRIRYEKHNTWIFVGK